MTIISKKICKVKCFVCGYEITYRPFVSYSNFGRGIDFVDLDFRPPGGDLFYDTLYPEIGECPSCGYVSNRIDEESIVPLTFFRTDSYMLCDNLNFKSGFARRFYRSYLINVEASRHEKALEEIMRAAWSCDDSNDIECAVCCRKKAMIEIDKIIIKGTKSDRLILIKADLLRRLGRFDELINGYNNIRFTEDTYNIIMDYQIKKAKELDDKRYNLSTAMDDAYGFEPIEERCKKK